MEVVPQLDRATGLASRVAILQKLAARAKVALPTDAALYIAKNVASNEAALNDALARLAAFSSLTGTQITLAFTQALLQTLIRPQFRTFSHDSLRKILERERGTNASTEGLGLHAGGPTAVSAVLTMQDAINRRVRSVLQVNMREHEREQLARRDVYERELQVRAWKRKPALRLPS